MESKAVTFIKELFLRLNDLEYCVLRNFELFPKIGQDLDLVVSDKDLEKFRDVLSRVSIDFDLKQTRILTHMSGIKPYCIDIYKIIDRELNTCIQIDLFNSFSHRTLPILSKEEILSSKRSHNGIYVISESLEIVIRSGQARKALEVGDVKRVIKLKNRLIELDSSLHQIESLDAYESFLKQRKLLKNISLPRRIGNIFLRTYSKLHAIFNPYIDVYLLSVNANIAEIQKISKSGYTRSLIVLSVQNIWLIPYYYFKNFETGAVIVIRTRLSNNEDIIGMIYAS